MNGFSLDAVCTNFKCGLLFEASSPPANAVEGDLLAAGDLYSLEAETAADATYVACAAVTRDECSLKEPSGKLNLTYTVKECVEAPDSAGTQFPQDNAGISEHKRDATFVATVPADCGTAPEAHLLRRSYTVKRESRLGHHLNSTLL